MAAQRQTISTKAFTDQKPGTSGLRKKVQQFSQPHYVENFVQATFDALASDTAAFGGLPSVLVLGGDGRHLSEPVCQTVIRMAAANGVSKILVGQHTLMSTPAVSAVVRTHPAKPTGAFILTASHNPGGPTGDFGMKYNCANGGPAPEKLTNLIFQKSTEIEQYHTLSYEDPATAKNVDLAVLGPVQVSDACTVEVIDSVAIYADLMASVFDFGALRTLVSRSDFSMCFDAMHGVAGPYAKRILIDMLGLPQQAVRNADPSEDFGGGHPDPNLTYAPALVKTMGLYADGTAIAEADSAGVSIPTFGAACDGDADRNMILGERFFVTPSDSVALLASKANVIPYFADRGGLKSVARSMPTSGALDLVAKALGVPVFEVPTGWKFFGNLMDSKELFGKEEYTPLICGEESFGTGSSHVREKDGLWAVLAWMAILADANKAVPEGQPLLSVKHIVEQHWATYGRNYYRRYDYEEVDSAGANDLMDALRALDASAIDKLQGVHPVAKKDDFAYVDPVDGSESLRQGIRVLFADGSRFVVRLSGTGSAGATIRLYLEQYMPASEVKTILAEKKQLPETGSVLEPLVTLAVNAIRVQSFTGRDRPTVIT